MAAAVFGARSRAANLAAVTGMLGVAVAGAAVAVAAAGSPAVISVAVAAAAVAGAPSEAPPVRTLIGPGRSYRPMPLRGRRRDDPVPLMCWECGKALARRQRRFCSSDCVTAFSAAHGKYPAAKPAALECEPLEAVVGR